MEPKSRGGADWWAASSLESAVTESLVETLRYRNTEDVGWRAALLSLLLPSVGWALSSGYWTYTVDGSNAATITKYSGTSTNVAIPDTIGGFAVKVIGSGSSGGAFTLARTKAVQIPIGVTNIADGAFSMCFALESVTVPPTVKAIGAGAFSWCTNLVSPTLSSGLETIGNGAFEGCAFASISVPSTVKNIGSHAFVGCKNLKSFTFPSSVVSVGDRAFEFCASLKSVFIGSGVSSVPATAFPRCASLASLEVDPSNPSYSSSDGVLFDKARKTLVRFPPAKIAATYAIPNGVVAVGSYSFQYCASLSSVVVPRSLAAIGNSSFSSCSNFVSLLFLGNAPTGAPTSAFDSSTPTVYYLVGSSGWEPTFGGRPTAVFSPKAGNTSLQQSAGFSFSWSGTGNVPMKVQRCTSLLNGDWTTIGVGAVGGIFTDPNPPRGGAFYRVSP